MLKFGNIIIRGFKRRGFCTPFGRSVMLHSFSKMFNQPFIIFFGCPGAGKTTFSQRYSKDSGIPVFTMGDEIRSIISGETAYDGDLEKISRKIAAGKLIKDDLAFEIFQNRMKDSKFKKGVILDGYPRKVS